MKSIRFEVPPLISNGIDEEGKDEFFDTFEFTGKMNLAEYEEVVRKVYRRFDQCECKTL